MIHMFPERKGGVTSLLTNFMSRILIYDHTFAFPRMIWYFALICLTFYGYPFSYVGISVILIYILYTFSAFLYYIQVRIYLSWSSRLKNFYSKRVLYIFLLPIFNFIVYWFRFAGIVNSIKGTSTWKTRGFDEELKECARIISNDFRVLTRIRNRIKKSVYNEKDV